MKQRSSTASAIGVWFIASVAAVLMTLVFGPLMGVLAACVGGVAFGLIAVRRLDARRVRRRVRRRSTPTTLDG